MSDLLTQRMRKASVAVYLATDRTVADDISGILKEAAENIEQAAKQSMQGDAVAYICEETNELTFDPYEKNNSSYKALYTHAPDIADLQAQVEALRKDAELGKLVRQKMTSGNDVPVSRCTITAAEIDAAISKGGE